MFETLKMHLQSFQAHVQVFCLWNSSGAKNFRIFNIAELINKQPEGSREGLTKAAISRIAAKDFFFISDLMRTASGMSPADKQRIIIEPLFLHAEKIVAQKADQDLSPVLLSFMKQKEFPVELHAAYLPRLLKIIETECKNEHTNVANAAARVLDAIKNFIPDQHKDIRLQMMTEAAGLIQGTVEKGRTNIDAATRRLERLAALIPADYVAPPTVVERDVKLDQTPAQVAFICAATNNLVPAVKEAGDFCTLRDLAGKFALAAGGKFEGFAGKNFAISIPFDTGKGVAAVFNPKSANPTAVVADGGGPLHVIMDIVAGKGHQVPVQVVRNRPGEMLSAASARVVFVEPGEPYPQCQQYLDFLGSFAPEA